MTQRLDATEAGLSDIEASLCSIDAIAFLGVVVTCLSVGVLIGIALMLGVRWRQVNRCEEMETHAP